MKKLKWYHYILGIILLSTVISVLLPSEKSTFIPIFQLYQVAGKSPEEVEKVLGKGKLIDSISDRRAGCKADCPKIQYGDIEIVYINGKADWIKVDNLGKYNYDEKAIELVGVEQRKLPDFKNNIVIRYTNFDEFDELQIFENGKGQINYIYIKIKTK